MIPETLKQDATRAPIWAGLSSGRRFTDHQRKSVLKSYPSVCP